MFQFVRPSNQHIEEYIDARRSARFTYSKPGMTRAEPPAGYVCDHNRILLGRGRGVFDDAVAGLKRWHQFELGWVRIANPQAPIVQDSTVCLVVHLAFIWALFACKIVYVLEDEGLIKKYGFAYGTLPGHPESGEERFAIEWNTEDDSVYYDIRAYSKPGNIFIALGKPFSRMMQKRFARNSMRVMKEIIQ